MKTLQELYNEVIANEELKKEFTASAKDGKAFDFIKKHGVDASENEIKTFFEELAAKEKELTPSELENAAGGTCNKTTGRETLASVFSAGVVCFFDAIMSDSLKDHHSGQQKDDEGRLCNKDK